MATITLMSLTPAQAGQQFPGCITDDILASEENNQVEEGYHRLGVLDGRLLSCCYEIAFLSWSAWDGKAWWNLEDLDWDLFLRLEDADQITWA